MAAETVTINQLCGVCREQVGTFEVKQENMMLSSRGRIWCPNCQADRPEVRDIAGRMDSIKKEVDSLPKQSTPTSSPESTKY